MLNGIGEVVVLLVFAAWALGVAMLAWACAVLCQAGHFERRRSLRQGRYNRLSVSVYYRRVVWHR